MGDTEVAGYLGKRFIERIINVMNRQTDRSRVGPLITFTGRCVGRILEVSIFWSVFTVARTLNAQLKNVRWWVHIIPGQPLMGFLEQEGKNLEKQVTGVLETK